MDPADDDVSLREDIARAMHDVRARAREAVPSQTPLEVPGGGDERRAAPLAKVEPSNLETTRSSPSRDELNALWDLESVLEQRPEGAAARLLSPLRSLLQRVLRFALGPIIERQTQVNSHQVRFDNEFVAYIDERLDGINRHYDEILGLHGKRMQEIDERHLILQEELIRHVHDLVQRIEFVFESAEQNHLYLEGMLREQREELSRLKKRLDSAAPIDDDNHRGRA